MLRTKETRHIGATALPHQSDGPRSTLGVETLKIIHVVAHCNKQIKEQLATSLHLHLHGAAALKRLPASNNER